MSASRIRAKGIKLSVIISAIVLLSVAATFAFNTLVGYQTQKRSLYNNTLDLNRITANEMSRTTNTIILSMKDAMKTAAAHFADSYDNEKTIQTEMDFFQKSVPYFNSVALVNEQGRLAARSPEKKSVVGERLVSDAAQQALKLKTPLISEPYTTTTTKRLIVLVSHPIFDSTGHYRGFIAGTIYLQEPNVFQNILGNQAQTENGSYYYVVDSSGILIYHPEMSRIGEKVTENPVVKKIMTGQNGQTAVTNTKGTRYLAGFSIVPSVGWGIVSQTPASNVTKSATEIVAHMAAISAPLVILLLLLVIWISHRLTYPLNRLAYWASKFNRGEGVAPAIPPAKNWNYEANELYRTVSEAFRIMGRRTQELSLEVNTDPLTGLANRRFLDAIVSQWIEEKVPFAVVMLDLDHFKSVNDTYGHQMGDDVLRFLAVWLNSEKREIDYGCRYGGEEFTLLMPYADEEMAFLVAERIRLHMRDEINPIGKPVTLSLGISSFPYSAQDAASLFGQADEALYDAKQNGRNRTVIYRAEKGKSEPQ
ncbi:diguanylate cyclase [Cohnella faecalis]|uniref:GGDEF domain-containing protein n=1 Tax=Cohnella faecalis TaxID=2315694 RepID=A0A398CIV5_9BACL|nr:sensor domain-containing diguanylate cyclase [Cohnella faecalis]RIE02315.1 GGDEF domain-containing protein [Cohnella faecalis]